MVSLNSTSLSERRPAVISIKRVAQALIASLVLFRLYGLTRRHLTLVRDSTQTPEMSTVAFHVRMMKKLHQQQRTMLKSSMNSTAAHSALPAWMQEYIAWHVKQIKRLTKDNWREHKFLISRCLQSDPKCGGVSDRLKTLPLLMLLAAQSRRIFLLHWSRPVALEEFLLPRTCSIGRFHPLSQSRVQKH